MKSLSVLLINKSYFPVVGGVERVVQLLGEGLRQRGIKTLVLACRSDYGSAYVSRVNRVPILYAGSFGTFLSMPVSISFFWYLYKLCLRYTIAHLHEPFPLGTLGLFAVNAKRRIVTFHSDIVRQKLLGHIFSKLQIILFNRSANVISTSPILITNSNVLRRLNRTALSIPIGIKLSERLPEPRDLVEWNYKNQNLKPYCLFVGRLVYYKGVENLVKAALATNAHLVILGQGPLEGVIRDLIVANDAKSRITLITGFVNDQTLKSWFWNCEFLVLPSIETSEAFGIVQVEAMAVGKAVINTNLPTGVPFVSLDRETGITIEVNNVPQLSQAISTLWSNRELSGQYGRFAAIRAKNEFDSEVMVSRYIEVYRQMFNSNK